MMKDSAYDVGKTIALKQLGLFKTATTDELLSQLKKVLPKSKTGKGALLGGGIGAAYGLHRLNDKSPKEQNQVSPPNPQLTPRY